MRDLVGFLGHGLVVELARLFGIEREVELILPAELKARLGERVVSKLRARVALGESGGVGGEFLGNDAVTHVLFVRELQMFLGRHVAEHGGRNMVVAGGDVGG